MLILGEAIIEGIGASLMLPATLAILSTTFQGRERATAFAAWGATAGVAAAFGPVVGGFLTTELLVALGVPHQRDHRAARDHRRAAVHAARRARRAPHPRSTCPARRSIAVGMFLLVFALSEGGIYGWWTPLKDVHASAGTSCGPRRARSRSCRSCSRSRSPCSSRFYFVERAKERRDGDPLFEFAHLRLRTFRYGLLTGLVLAMGQLGLSFVLPVFLQDGRHLTAASRTGCGCSRRACSSSSARRSAAG